MALKAEAIGKDRRIVNVPGRWVKNQTARKRRRQERRDPEHVPPRATRGWYA